MRRWLRLQCMRRGVVVLLAGGLFWAVIGGCGCMSGRIRPPRRAKLQVVTMQITGYDSCGKCCNWRRNWLGRPVIASGPSKGKPKKVGITSNGSEAKHGTIAADTRYYPFGTVMYIPGYGYGRVEDRGGAIKGANRIDLYFDSHKKALRWGRKRVKVKVWR